MVTFTASNPYMVKVGINFHRKCSSANIIYFKSFHVYSSWIEMIEIHVDRRIMHIFKIPMERIVLKKVPIEIVPRLLSQFLRASLKPRSSKIRGDLI